MEMLLQDLRYSLRMLRKSSGFTTLAVISLALAIGANTTIFTFVNALLFRPPAVGDAGKLLEVMQRNTKESGIFGHLPLAYPDYLYYRDHNQVLSGMAAFDGEMRPTSWSQAGGGEMTQIQLVSSNFFAVLGVDPVLGRAFLPEEEQTTAPPVAVLSHSFWLLRLSADPNVLARSLTLNGATFSVVGVAPASFTGIVIGNEPDMWVPFGSTPQITHDPNLLNNFGSDWLFGVGRLRQDVSPKQARANLILASHSLQQEHPAEHANLEAAAFAVQMIPEPYRLLVGGFTGLLMAISATVLLIACMNVANLLLVRFSNRHRDFAVRSALGATRRRLIRQTLTETMLLSLVGASAGLVAAKWLVPSLLALKPAALPLRIDAPIDWRVFGFTAGLALFAGAVFGLLPVLKTSRLELVSALKGEGYISRFRQSKLQSGLLVGQVAVSLLLVIGACLCLRSLVNARSIDPGFDTQHVLAATLDPGALGYSEEHGQKFYAELLDRVARLPGVQSAGLTGFLPLGTASAGTLVNIAGQAIPAGGNGIPMSLMNVGPGFFQTMGIPILHGREFGREEKNAVVINHAMAQQFWPGEDPVGRYLGVGDGRFVIIGIAKTGKYMSLGERDQPFLYMPLSYRPRQTLLVRTQGDPQFLISSVRHEIYALDPNIVPVELETMQQYMALPLFPVRAVSLLLGGSGLFALLLAMGGLYGVISYSVSRRTREIGVRMALGAGEDKIVRMIVTRGLQLTAAGAVIGLAAAFAATRALSSMLYGISSTDGTTFCVVFLSMLLVAFVASYIPAKRAAKVDPMVALRYE
jgi:predicted permease